MPGKLVGAGARGIAFIDVDDTIHGVQGYAKQGAAWGYTGVRGLNVQVATICTPITAPAITRARLRKGCGRLLQQAISTARAAGVTGRVIARVDSAYYG